MKPLQKFYDWPDDLPVNSSPDTRSNIYCNCGCWNQGQSGFPDNNGYGPFNSGISCDAIETGPGSSYTMHHACDDFCSDYDGTEACGGGGCESAPVPCQCACGSNAAACGLENIPFDMPFYSNTMDCIQDCTIICGMAYQSSSGNQSGNAICNPNQSCDWADGNMILWNGVGYGMTDCNESALWHCWGLCCESFLPEGTIEGGCCTEEEWAWCTDAFFNCCPLAANTNIHDGYPKKLPGLHNKRKQKPNPRPPIGGRRRGR